MIELSQLFHWYGLIVGLAVVIVWQLMEQLLAKANIKLSLNIWLVIGLGALVGARLWHVMTDWSLYADGAWWQWGAIWQGGLSILGAVVGGLAGLGLAQKWWKIPRPTLLVLLDSAAIALPFGQALGRVANYVNQELYGLPTTLPWGIYIEPQHRLAGYEQITRFHPLFAYEAVLLLLFGVTMYGLWHTKRELKSWYWGSGWWFWWYLLYYFLVRFGLDFLRVDKVLAGSFGGSAVSVNQVFLLSGIVVLLGYWVKGICIQKHS